MFKFLKEKIKASIKSISEKIRKEKEVVEGPKEEVKEESEEVTEAKVLPKEEAKEQVKAKEEKKGIFSKLKEKLTTTKINEERFDELFQELEMSLLENNVAYEVIDKIKDDL